MNRRLVITGKNIHQIDFQRLVVSSSYELILSSTKKSYRCTVADDFFLSNKDRHYLQASEIEINVIPEYKFDHFRLIVSDMDSTLITIECIDEIAAWMGKKDEVCALTERAMTGQMDFQQALQERVALLKGLPETDLAYIYQQKLKLTPGAKELVNAVKKVGGTFVIVSGGFTFFSEKLKQVLGADKAYANELEVVGGCLTGKILGPIVDGAKKLAIMQNMQQNLGIASNQVIAIGDGANDLPMLENAGLGIAFCAKAKVQEKIPCQIHGGDLSVIPEWFL